MSKKSTEGDTQLTGPQYDLKQLPYSFYKFPKMMKKPQEDLIHYIANYFNSQQDFFCLLIVTRDSPIKQKYAVDSDTLILSANWMSCTNENSNAISEASDSDTECVKLKTQILAGIYAKEIEQFIEKYWEKAWGNDFEGDKDINEEITRDIINNNIDLKNTIFSCHDLQSLQNIARINNNHNNGDNNNNPQREIQDQQHQ